MTFDEGDRFFTRIGQQAKLQTRSAAADPAHQRIGEALGDKIFTVSAVLLWAALTAVTVASITRDYAKRRGWPRRMLGGGCRTGLA